MRLYGETEVAAIERTAAFRVFQERIAARRCLAIARASSQQAAALALADAIPIEIPAWDDPTLKRLALEHARACSRDLLPERLQRAGADSVQDFATWYLVGWASVSEEWLAPLWGRPGFDHATFTLRVRILAEVVRLYPGLRDGVTRALGDLARDVVFGELASSQVPSDDGGATCAVHRRCSTLDVAIGDVPEMEFHDA